MSTNQLKLEDLPEINISINQYKNVVSVLGSTLELNMAVLKENINQLSQLVQYLERICQVPLPGEVSDLPKQ